MRIARSRLHFVGIGGVGMSGLAELLHNLGAKVSGSDLTKNTQIERLQDLGVEIVLGHRSENVGSVDVVVFSSAVNLNNPEILQAQKLGIPIVQRAEVLAEIMRLKRGIAVGGSHGKTTTTSMLAQIFIQAQFDPTIVVGGRLDLIKSTALLGQGEWIVAEADESDGSFLRLSPEIAIITNIDDDHLDHHKSFENLQTSFLEFARKVPFYGLAVVCGDDLRSRHIFNGFNKRVVFYGLKTENDVQIRGERGVYDYLRDGKVLGKYYLELAGQHNALNAAAAITVALECGISFEVCAKALEKFKGVDRRFQKMGECDGIQVYDDYGHHPTEVRAVLSAFKEKFPASRLIVVFQPHRYSRTKICWNDFLTCFKEADILYLCDIYAASETSIPEVNSKRLSQEISHEHVTFVGSVSEALPKISANLKSGDVVITLGAGDVWRLTEPLLSNLRERPKTCGL